MFWFKKSDVFVLPDRYFQPVLRDFWVKNGHTGTFYTKPATQENQEFDMSTWQNMQISLGFYAGRDTKPCHENSIFPPFATAMSGAVFSLGNRKCAIVFPHIRHRPSQPSASLIVRRAQWRKKTHRKDAGTDERQEREKQKMQQKTQRETAFSTPLLCRDSSTKKISDKIYRNIRAHYKKKRIFAC